MHHAASDVLLLGLSARTAGLRAYSRLRLGTRCTESERDRAQHLSRLGFVSDQLTASLSVRLPTRDAGQHAPPAEHQREGPGVEHTKLYDSDCVRGWVTWQVPAGQRPSFIIDTKMQPAIKFQV